MKPDGTLVGRSFRFTNTKQGFEFLMDKLAAVDSSLENFEFGMEATGTRKLKDRQERTET